MIPTAVQNERQPRNTATIKQDSMNEQESERLVREGVVATVASYNGNSQGKILWSLINVINRSMTVRTEYDRCDSNLHIIFYKQLVDQ